MVGTTFTIGGDEIRRPHSDAERVTVARRLKVFRAHLGFYDTIVAAPSQKAALEAWGAGANEFHQGFAAETKEPALVAAALEKPGIVLKRQFGTKGAFEPDAPALAAPKAVAGRRGAQERARRKREAEKARKAAEAERKAAKRERDEKLREIERRQAELQAERDAVEAEFRRSARKPRKASRQA
jgi:colicin import membrane protein